MDSLAKLREMEGLAIEGGGVAGIAYVGALREWVDQGYTIEQWKYIVGSSAGAILAAMIAVRAPVEYMEKILYDTDFNTLKDSSWNYLKHMYDLYSNYGWYDGDKLEEWVAKSLGEITGNRDITFQQVYEKYGTHLMITKTDVLWPQCKTVVMDYLSHPNEKIAHAVRTSGSIPFIFEAVRGEGTEKNHLFVDGGVLMNYPIEILKDYLDQSKIMGLCLLDDEDNNHKDETIQYRPVNGYIEFILTMLKSWRELAMHKHVSSDQWKRTCDIPVLVSATDFDISDKAKDECVESGKQRMRTFIQMHS